MRTMDECELVPFRVPLTPFEFPFMQPFLEDIARRTSVYVARRGIEAGAGLGSGKDGTVISAVRPGVGVTAVKTLVRHDLFVRERACYERLAQHGIGGSERVCGHEVPRMIDSDEELLVVEMTIVSRPYVLDFAGAYLDDPPEFPAEVMAERREHWAEIFEERWPQVRRILAAFQRVGVHLLDPSPSNIAFVEPD